MRSVAPGTGFEVEVTGSAKATETIPSDRIAAGRMDLIIVGVPFGFCHPRVEASSGHEGVASLTGAGPHASSRKCRQGRSFNAFAGRAFPRAPPRPLPMVPPRGIEPLFSG